MGQPEVQGLASPHGQTRQRAVFTGSTNRITGFHRGQHVIQQIPFEPRKSRGMQEHIAFGPVIGLGVAVGA